MRTSKSQRQSSEKVRRVRINSEILSYECEVKLRFKIKTVAIFGTGDNLPFYLDKVQRIM